MNCPKCSQEMHLGEIAYTYGKGCLLWAPREYLDQTVCNMFTKKSLIAAGGFMIPLGDGLLRDRTKGYACQQCNFVLIDCNG